MKKPDVKTESSEESQHITLSLVTIYLPTTMFNSYPDFMYTPGLNRLD